MTMTVRVRRRPGQGSADAEVSPALEPALTVQDAEEPTDPSPVCDQPVVPAGDGVGYGNPPRHSRCQAGRSGNPRGRPKGSRSLVQLVVKELNQKVQIRENGRTCTIRKCDLVAKQLVKKGAEGDLRALAQIMRMQADAAQTDGAASSSTHGAADFSAAQDQEIMAQFLATFIPATAQPDGESGGQSQ